MKIKQNEQLNKKHILTLPISCKCDIYATEKGFYIRFSELPHPDGSGPEYEHIWQFYGEDYDILCSNLAAGLKESVFPVVLDAQDQDIHE